MLRLYSSLIASWVWFMPSAVPAQTCPALLEGARRLVLVTFDSMSSSNAVMRLFERTRSGGAWQRLHGPEPAVLGINGAAWGPGFLSFGRPGDPQKREGDRRTPAGIFALGPPFGFAPSRLARYMQLRSDTVCVDDPRSGAYNTITSRRNVADGMSVEVMREGTLYRRGVVVRYPTDALTRAGSCIFIHVWQSPGSATVGCIALSERGVAALQEFAAQQPSVLGVLPEKALGRLASCLPTRTATPH